MKRSLVFAGQVLLGLLALAPAARAADWYVDAVSGSNANAGTSPALAWKTISWAVAHVPQLSIERVHVAPGTYDPALGETFPIVVAPGVQLVSDAGVATTLVSGGGGNTPLFIYKSDQYGAGWSYDQNTILQGFSLSNATNGVLMTSNWSCVSPLLRDLLVTQASGAGIGMSADVQFAGCARPVLENVRIEGCGAGVTMNGGCQPVLSDCVLRGNTSYGAMLGAAWAASVGTFRRCRIEGNAQGGVFHSAGNSAFTGSSANSALEDCLISGNGVNGLAFYRVGATSSTLARCTIANNGGAGFFATPQGTWPAYLTLEHSIVDGNRDDIDGNWFTTTAHRNLIGDGDFAGTNGNFAADPLFVDAAGHDWRLRWGSPCIDAATAGATAGSLDLARHPRTTDGDLDTSEVFDLGAFEFRPLGLAHPVQIGTPLRLELWGPQGNASTLQWARLSLLAPTATPFGERELSPGALVFARVRVGSGTPTIVQRGIPLAQSLIGLTFSFQALTDSAAAPQGKAYTNGVEFTIAP